ncbi:MAG: ABC transporter substrate-binding protein [Elioraea sp.]|nr:MAG: ABC transporter substrate-binding protein [Elioraea sp.]
MMTSGLRPLLLAAACTGAIAGTAAAQNLTIAVGAPVTSIDPHYHNLSPNNAMAAHIFDGLADTDSRARLVPGLAESWRTIDDTTWEFRLRRGVKFHNGSDFTAEDVAFTISRAPNVPNSPSGFGIFTRPIAEVQVVDPHTVRIRTRTVYPLLAVDLSNVMILDRETHENATTEDFNSGKAAVGTGPYRFVRFAPGDRIELERNDTYWGGRQPWQRVNYRIIVNEAARTAALLAGDVDLIDQVPTADIARLKQDQRLNVSEVVGLRIIYLALDHSRTDGSPFVSGPNGEALDRNPLKDVRVRRALSIAIDRNAIVSRVMEGAAIPAGQFLPEGTYSHVPGLNPPAFDPDGARRLLAEAGYPNGLRLAIHGPNDRYVNDARIIQAIGSFWTRIGVRTQVEAMPWTTFIARAGRQEFSAFLVGWGSSTGEASSPLRSLVATFNREKGFGASNRGRYSNPELDRLLEQALATVDDEKREKLLQDATRVAMEDVAIIPIHIQKNVWAMKRGLRHDARADELTRAMDVRPGG